MASLLVATSSAAAASVNLPGTFQTLVGCATNWMANCPQTAFAPPAAGSNIWSISLNLPAGTYQYKVALDDSWTVNYGANGVLNGANMALTVTGATTRVTFSYNAVTKITTAALPLVVTAAGDFQSAVGCPNWSAACAGSTLSNFNAATSEYSGSVKLAAGSYNYKVTVGGTWAVNYGANGAANGVNMPFSLSSPSYVLFTWNSVSKVTTIAIAIIDDFPTSTVVPSSTVTSDPISTSTTTIITTTSVPTSTVTGTVTTTPPGPGPTVPADLPGCETFTGDSCTGSQTAFPSSFDERRWQTPPRGAGDWSAGFQDYRDLTGYADVVYTDTSRGAATVTVIANSRTNSPLQFSFNGVVQSSNTFRVTSSLRNGLNIIVTAPATGATLTLDPVYFVWDTPAITGRGETLGGQKGAIVELFGWPFKDVAKECEFLGKAGYMGVRVWAPNEHLTTDHWLEGQNNRNPWYFVYQPVSYRLFSRHGTLEDIRTMVTTCHSFGVRVYADAVINHMVGGANDIQNHRRGGANNFCATWGPKNGTAGSPFYTHSNTYQFNRQTGLRPADEFPAVPWSPSDFHCDRPLNSYDAFTMNYGYLSGLVDLNTEKPNVQDRLATYLASLLNVGFSGFRIDAAKHISPDGNAAILKRLADKMGGGLPSSFITWLEVIIGGEKGLLACEDGPYNFYGSFDRVMQSKGLSASDISKVKIWSSDYPKEAPVCGYWILPPSRFVIQNDDHDQQNEGSSSRDMQDFGSVFIKDRNVARHRSFEVKLFQVRSGQSNDWAIRTILSSYSWKQTPTGLANGFPDGQSDCSGYKGTQSGCASMPFRPAFVANACGYSNAVNGGWIEGEYTRVHRDISIVNAMRSWMGMGSVSASALGLPGNCQ
ncbi:hypothetical protein HDU67_005871 [Dinochytrium kinnereticum]|nr:hypothetical protein HDU67_005871 [Dinochytrium kinnereticum]